MVSGMENRRVAFRDRLLRFGVESRLLKYYESHLKTWVNLKLQVPPGNSQAQFYASWLLRNGRPEWFCRQAFQAVEVWLEITAEAAAERDAVKNLEMEDGGSSIKTKNWGEVILEMTDRLRAGHYSVRTIESYLDWVRRFAAEFPLVPVTSEQASSNVGLFLRGLSVGRNLSPASVALARNALAWLVIKGLNLPLVLEHKSTSHHSRRLPTVLAPQQVRILLKACSPPWDLFFSLQYGCGLRLMELLDLRVQDVDLHRWVLTVRHGKGDKDRVLPIPNSLRERLTQHLSNRRLVWDSDFQAGHARVNLPQAVARKWTHADTSWDWQHLFGSFRPLRHPETGELRRWRPMETVVRDALRKAAEVAGLMGRIHPHLLRHCYATHLLESGMPLKQIQELMGHARLETTMVYLHVRSNLPTVHSPLDSLV
jgi:integron integrase